jgi:hypothetical protein
LTSLDPVALERTLNLNVSARPVWIILSPVSIWKPQAVRADDLDAYLYELLFFIGARSILTST